MTTKFIIGQDLLQRAASYCSDETTKKEIESLLFRGWMEENDWRDICDGIYKTTSFPTIRRYY